MRMKKTLWLLTLILMMVALLGCSSQQSTMGYQTISPEEAKKMMDSGSAYILVDVRTQAEYDEGHIPGAILIPNETITDEVPAALTDKKAVILIYCRSGNRSAQAAEKLAKMGYEQIYDFGGIIDWPYETTQ